MVKCKKRKKSAYKRVVKCEKNVYRAKAKYKVPRTRAESQINECEVANVCPLCIFAYSVYRSCKLESSHV